MDGYHDPQKPGKRRLKRNKERTLRQLEAKLAAWKDKREEYRANQYQLIMRWHLWWLDLSAEEQAKRVEGYREERRRGYLSALYDPDDPHPHPDSPRGQQIIEEAYFVAMAGREIAKVEARIARRKNETAE